MSGLSLHVHVSATVIWISDRLQIGQAPGPCSWMAAWIGQLQIDSSRTGTSAILHSGQLPGLSSMTSGCIGHVIASGGSFGTAAGRARCGAAAVEHTNSPNANAMTASG